MDEQIMRIVGACAMVKVHAGEVVTWAPIEVRIIISQHSQSAQRAQIKKWQPAFYPTSLGLSKVARLSGVQQEFT